MPIQRLTAWIADGISSEIRRGRITVKDHFIEQVEYGSFAPENASDIAVSDNLIVAPAFIDAHGHSDISVFAMPKAEGKTSQGIAFEISGNCGLSPFPLTEQNRSHLQELYRNYHIPLDWSDYTSYKSRLDQLNARLELLPLVGHNTLRAAVAGYEKKNLTCSEQAMMCDLLDRELASGALGLSGGLLYVPGCFASHDELVELLKVVARHDKIFSIHLKSEGDALEEALSDTLHAARASGLKKLHLSHLKTAGRANYHKAQKIIDALNSQDLRVTGDLYCYNASMTQLSVILPNGFDCYDDVKLMELLKSEDFSKQLLAALSKERSSDYWQQVRIVSAPEPYRRFNGCLITDAASHLNITPENLYLDILRRDATGATGAFHTLSQENMELFAAHTSTVPGSDESARHIAMDFGSSHPRGFGNHAEYFALRRQQGAPLGSIIREMSAQIAEIFNLKCIGSLQKGKRAVFTVIDPEQYKATATFEHPHSPAQGAEIWRM